MLNLNVLGDTEQIFEMCWFQVTNLHKSGIFFVSFQFKWNKNQLISNKAKSPQHYSVLQAATRLGCFKFEANETTKIGLLPISETYS